MTITAGRMGLVWMASMGVVLAVLAGLWVLGERAVSNRLASVQTLVIGTSLVQYGIPDPEGRSLATAFGPAPQLRLAYSAASEEQLFAITAMAARHGVQRLFIEVNPIVSRFAFKAQGCGLAGWIEHHFIAMRRTFRAAVTGQDVMANALARPSDQDQPRVVDKEVLTRLYPLRLTGSCSADRWATLFAAHPDMQVVLIAMPRAPVARDRIGADGMAKFNTAARQFATATGMQLFIVDPEGTWPTDAFIDQGHMSPEGSARFMAGLAAYASKLP